MKIRGNKGVVVDQLFKLAIQNGHGVNPPAPNECVKIREAEDIVLAVTVVMM